MMINLLIRVLLLIGLILGNQKPKDHAIYISVIEIDHAQKRPELLLRIKIFSDDLDDVIKNAAGVSMGLKEGKDPGPFVKELEQYILQKVSLTLNQSKLHPKIRHIEQNGDTHWIQLGVGCPEEWEELRVKTNLLTELFPTQANIVRVNHGSEKRFARLTKNRPEISFEF